MSALAIEANLKNFALQRYIFESGVWLFSLWQIFERLGAVPFSESSNACRASEIFVESFSWAQLRLQDIRANSSEWNGLARFSLEGANARCYVALISEKSNEEILRVYADLRSAISKLGRSDFDLPTSILHTKCCVLFKLREELGDSGELKVCLGALSAKLDELEGDETLSVRSVEEMRIMRNDLNEMSGFV